MRPALITVGWLLAGLAAWSGAYNAVTFLIIYLANERQWHFPTFTANLLNVIGIGIALLIPVVVVLMGMRRKLPGTRPNPVITGFAVESRSPVDAG